MQDSFVCKYRLNSKQFEALSRVLDPLLVRFPQPGDKEKLVTASHPVPAALNAFAYQKCLEVASKYKRSIDIGGTPLRTPKDHHLCTLVNDCRTDARYSRAAFNQRGAYYNKLIDMRSYLHNPDNFCIKGVQSCNYQAEYAYCINAAYDIDIELWPEIFAMHNLTVVDLWLFMPFQLLNKYYEADKDIYNININGDIIVVDYLDHSNNYTHSVKNWYKYFETTVIECKNFALVFEMESNYGTFTNIKITRTKYTNGLITRTIKVSNYIDTAIVPDMYHYIMNNQTYKDIYEKNFSVPIVFLNRLTNWATGQMDDAFKYNNFAIFAFSIVNQVRYASGASETIVYEGMDVNSVDFERIKISCFIIIAIMRYKRSIAVAQAFKKLKTNQYVPGKIFNNFIIWLKHAFGERLHTVTDFLTSWLDDSNKDQWISKSFIYNATFLYPEDMQFSKTIKSDYGHHFNDYKIIDPYKSTTSASAVTITATASTATTSAAPAPTTSSSTSATSTPTVTAPATSSPPPTTQKQIIISNNKCPAKAEVEHSTTNISCQCKVIYDPPGDGRCGEHALRYINDHLLKRKEFKCEIVASPISKNFKPLPKDWYSDEDLINLAYSNNINLVVHANGIPVIRSIELPGPIHSINCNMNHWQVVDCSCCYTRHMICDYYDVPIRPDYLYVNAANEKLQDRGGQALSFANKFPGYAQGFTVPIDIVQFQKLKLQDDDGITPVHLCAAVSHNNSGCKNVQKTVETYHKIFREIERYALQNKLTVILPTLGTGIYGGDLCCFKNVIAQYKFNRIIVHLTQRNLDNYNNTGPCKHGGYKVIRSNAKIILTDDAEPKKDHSVIPNNLNEIGKMRGKLDDILDYLHDHDVPLDNIHELSAAPGDFARLAPHDINYITSVYVGSGALKWQQAFKSDYQYNNLNEHIEEIITLRRIDNQNYVYLFDFMPDQEQIKSLMKLLYVGGDVITKFSSYGDANLVEKFNTMYNTSNVLVTIIQNDHSDIRSSEFYVHLSLPTASLQSVNLPMQTISTAEIQDTQITAAMKKVEEHQCNCNTHDYYTTVDDKINCTIEWTLTNSGNYFKDFVENDDKLQFNNTKTTLDTIAGAAGSRKTQSLIKNKDCCPKCTLIITPFNAISKSNNDQVQGISKTFVTAINNLKQQQYKTVVIDEALAMSGFHVALIKHYAKEARVIGATDPYQITYRNYHDTVESYVINYHPGKEYINTTYRVPQIVCDIFKDYVSLMSKSTNKGKVTYRKLEEFQPIDNISHVYLTFTQDMCNYFKNKFTKCRNNITTVNASQGGTYDFVHLYYPDYIKITEQHFSYIYTAMTRCRTELIIYSADGKSITLPLLDTPVQRAIDANVLTMHDTTVIQEKDVQPKPQHANLVAINTINSTKQIVEEVLSRNLAMANEPFSACIGYFSRTIPQNVAGHNCKFSIDYQQEKAVIRGRRLGRRPYNLIYAPKNTTQITHCLLTRYAKQDKHLPPTFMDRYVKGFETWLKPNYRQIIRDAVNPNDLYINLIDYIKNLQKKFSNVKNTFLQPFDLVLDKPDLQRIKNIRSFGELHKKLITDDDTAFKSLIYKMIEVIIGSDTHTKIKDLELEFDDLYHKAVQFHLKRQPKLVLKDGFDTQNKAGQGVSAWSKMLNIIFSGFIRCVAQAIPKVLKENVQLAYGKSDRDISLFFQRFSEQIATNTFKKLGADFSEFDSSQEMQGILAGLMFKRMCNVPENICQLYMEQRRKWMLLATDKNNVTHMMMRAILHGFWKQHSGQPETLDGNTTFNMMAMGACYNVEQLAFASFKGDDSEISARKIQRRVEGTTSIQELAGFNIKEDYSEIQEYIANIILPNGTFFPDVVRRASRILSKIYTEQADWHEQRQSIMDCLDVILDDRHYQYGLSVAQEFYKQHGVKITADEINAIIAWMKDLTKLDNINDVPVDDHIIFNY